MSRHLYRKKPIVVEAKHISGPDRLVSISVWLDGCGTPNSIHLTPTGVPYALNIITLEGEMRAEVGDWVIKGVKGEFYPVKPDIFDATYEEVTA